MKMGEILGIRGPLQADAADALACAVTCAHTLRLADVTKLGKLQARTGTRSHKTASSRRSAWTQLAQNRNTESK